MTPAPLLRLHGVSKSFPDSNQVRVPVLENVNLTMAAGEKVSLVGPSGSGKSTLLALIAGLLRPDAGTVEIDGRSVGDQSDSDRARVRAQRVGIALQSDNLIPFLSAQENVELAFGFGHRVGRRDARAAASALLARFGVEAQARQRPRQLSGGEAQRVALAVAMAGEPGILLADEVVAALDGDTAGRVIDEVLAAGFAVLYVTHDRSLADRVTRRYELIGRTVRAR